jgi:hypothetical protein
MGRGKTLREKIAARVMSSSACGVFWSAPALPRSLPEPPTARRALSASRRVKPFNDTSASTRPPPLWHEWQYQCRSVASMWTHVPDVERWTGS